MGAVWSGTMNWKINEIANLYDISAHTLRYYEEINLVVPNRGENNYRIVYIRMNIYNN